MENNCYIGIGATIRNGVRIAEESLVGAGSLVLRDTEPYSRNVGHPARVLGYHREEGLGVKL
jgi:acetyltransferase-like isoleucine patch superfamily enzyme